MNTTKEFSEGQPISCTFSREEWLSDSEEDVEVESAGTVIEADENKVFVETNRKRLRINLENQSVTIEQHDLYREVPEHNGSLISISELTAEDAYLSEERLREKDLTEEEIKAIIERGNEAIDRITDVLGQQWLTEKRWINHHEAIRCQRIYENGINQRIKESNERWDSKDKIVFPTEEAVIVWTQEVLGQLSDGAWENEHVDWEMYHELKIELDTSQETITTTGEFEPWIEFENTLCEYEGQKARMMFEAIMGSGNENVSMENIRSILSQLDNLSASS